MLLLFVLLTLGLAAQGPVVRAFFMPFMPFVAEKKTVEDSSRVLLSLIALCMCLATIASLAGFFEGKAINGAATNWSPLLVLSTGLIMFSRFGASAFARARELAGSRAGVVDLRFGGLFVGALASLFLVFCALDHFWFARGGESGVASPQAMGVSDVPCDLAIFRVEKDTIEYRCPKDIVFNDRFTHPFIPWPSYIEGRSALFKQKYDEMMQAAESSPPR